MDENRFDLERLRARADALRAHFERTRGERREGKAPVEGARTPPEIEPSEPSEPAPRHWLLFVVEVLFVSLVAYFWM